MAQRGGQTNKHTENLPILRDFVSYRGCFPASPKKTKEKLEQGKGTADYLMPSGYLLVFFLGQIANKTCIIAPTCTQLMLLCIRPCLKTGLIYIYNLYFLGNSTKHIPASKRDRPKEINNKLHKLTEKKTHHG